ncbi:LytR/AlgR family response regulator transcription factor [Geofilum rubicundum]|uniref:Transcriptional regulatory protein n=1 Tax=Geofilum rubicundum JCM 15548 TaxID=1236989 RepID=A0A0E9LRH2_9BACT|nr:response regulator [Geofilum rubicundum]GAO27873.1 transcriptional regulatory protein [Geofilum rubicundum JCM 15548]
MYKVIIADDEPRAIEVLEKLLGNFAGYTVIKTIRDESEILPSVIALEPDLLFLDINLGQTTGMDVARELNMLGRPLQIIFITAYNQYALEAFDCKACDYLLKPVSLARLSQALKHFEEHYHVNVPIE